jgi:cytoskeleton protein RodZ
VSFGAELQQERLKRDVSLEAIAESTKVGMPYLRALEEGNYAKLPGGVFNRGIMRGYCRFLGLNEEEWLERFQAFARSEGEEDWTEFAQNVKRSRASYESRNRLRWLGVMVMVLLLGIAIWAVLHFVFGVDFHWTHSSFHLGHASVVSSHRPAPLNG